MFKKKLHYILLFLLVIDLIYSFIQHSNIELDGDMAFTILPDEFFRKVLDDPLGLSVLFKNEIYAAPNRFFAHWMYSEYFKVVPGVLQNFVNPVDSVYLASAIAKTVIQAFLIIVLASCICGREKMLSRNFLIAAVLVTPFFITYQYYRLGIIDQHITFVFFYALPFALLLLFFLPFFKKLFYGQAIKTNLVYRIYLVTLALIISLSGALMPAVIVIVCPLVLLVHVYLNFEKHDPSTFINKVFFSIKKIPNDILFYFVLASVFSAYSLYIGRNNIENMTVELSLSERYLLLPKGFVMLFDQMSLLIPLLIVIAINIFIIRIYFFENYGKKMLVLLKWILICSLIYILLLPLGGYRTYRPYILRYDTILPVTIALITIFGMTTNFLILNLHNKAKVIFTLGIIFFLLIYIYEDKPAFGNNECQRRALFEISESQEEIVVLNSDCTIMSWEKITDYKQSELNSELLFLWGVTKEKKLYYQK